MKSKCDVPHVGCITNMIVDAIQALNLQRSKRKRNVKHERCTMFPSFESFVSPRFQSGSQRVNKQHLQ